MPQQLITTDDVEKAYILHKGEVYHDRSNLHKRMKIAEFEASGNVQKTFEEIAYAINNYEGDGWNIVGNYYNKNDNDVIVLPHTFEKDNVETINKISNRHDNFNLSKVVVLFDESIELDIINALWLMYVGVSLQYNVNEEHYEIADKDLYGNILNVDKNGDFKNKRLFKNYSSKYNDWINYGIKIAKRKIAEEENVTLVSLDIKDFYHSVLIDYNHLPIGRSGELGRILNRILGDAARHHMNKLGIQRDDEFCFLPVGPFSSPVIANWLLHRLDEDLRGNRNCVYYGRYVDDIFMVFHNDSGEINNVSSMKDFFDNYYNNSIYIHEGDNGEIKIVVLNSLDDLEFKEEKFKVAVVNNTDSIAIQSFEDILIGDSSFPDDYYTNEDDEDDEKLEDRQRTNDFEENGDNERRAFSLMNNNAFYQTVTEKFNDLLKKNNPRYELAIQLDKIIEGQLTGPYEIDESLSNLLLGFFHGNYIITFYNLWERVFSFLFAIEDIDNIKKMIDNIGMAVISLESIEHGSIKLSDDDLVKNIRSTLFKYLELAVSLAASLNPTIIDKLDDGFIDMGSILNNVKMFRHSHMLRREYMLLPFTFYSIAQLPDNINLLSKNLWNDIIAFGDKLLIKNNYNDFIPLYPSLFDISMSEFVYLLKMNSSKDGDVFHTYKRADCASPYTYLEDIESTYNNTHNYKFKILMDKEGLRRSRRHVVEQTDRIIFFNNKKTDPDKKVGLANIKVDIDRIKDCISDGGLCRTNAFMYKRHRKLLDMAQNENVKVMVLPEVFVPLQFIYVYQNDAVHNRRAFIFGLEHFHVANKCYNMSCMLLPFYINNKREVLPLFRIKNYYSPTESEGIKKTGFKVPNMQRAYYHWIDWYGLQFSLFNCYELTNIIDCSLFKHKVDALFAIEYNKDTRYYSNLAEATARDNDCFFIQANSSDYGDTRIVSPQKDILKDKVRIKGGENDVILTCTLDINGLRNHLLGITLDDKDIYKKTSAGFDRNAVKSRVNHRNRLKILGIVVEKKK